MKLLELEPKFYRFEIVDGVKHHVPAASIDAAQGLWFLCPACFKTNGGAIGTHGVICWSRSRGVPEDAQPGPGRWKLVGTGFHDLTLEADPPNEARSIQLHGGCNWHGFVTNGEAHE